jgi:hypothetical protein
MTIWKLSSEIPFFADTQNYDAHNYRTKVFRRRTNPFSSYSVPFKASREITNRPTEWIFLTITSFAHKLLRSTIASRKIRSGERERELSLYLSWQFRRDLFEYFLQMMVFDGDTNVDRTTISRQQRKKEWNCSLEEDPRPHTSKKPMEGRGKASDDLFLKNSRSRIDVHRRCLCVGCILAGEIDRSISGQRKEIVE